MLIAQSLGKTGGSQAGAGDAGGDPGWVYLGEQTGDLIPAGAFAGLAGIADEHDIEVESVTGGVDHAVGSAASQVAEAREKLEEKGGRMRFGVGSYGADSESGEPVEGGFAQLGVRGGAGLGGASCLRRRHRFGRLGGLFGLRLAQKVHKFGLASVYVGVRGHWGRSLPVAVCVVMIRHYYGFGI